MANTYNFGATAAVHSLRAYVKRNPYKGWGGMTFDDFDAMFDLFVAENAEISATANFQDSAETGTLSFPGAIAAADTEASRDQANYPEKHKGS